MTTEFVNSQIENGVNTIEFFHPQSNSLPSNLLTSLTNKFNEASIDNNTKVIILKSAGNNVFCAGASFNELTNIKNENEGVMFFSGFANVINAMRKCNKLIIASIQGKCVGGGVGLAAAADYAIATPNAKIKLSELTIGIGPFVIAPVIKNKMGISAFSELAINATNWYDATWAHQKGLFAELHTDITSMENASNKLANKLATYNPNAMIEIKKEIWKNTENWDSMLLEQAAISGKLILNDFSKIAINQLLKK